MLRELCSTSETAHHNQYQRGLHSQFVLLAYTMTLQCVIERKVMKMIVLTIFLDILHEKQVHGGYICSGNCVQPSKQLTTTNINVVCIASPFC